MQGMGIVELLLLAIGLSMDAFAVSICVGLTMLKARCRKAFITGLYFGGFQAGMPLIGYYAAALFADYIIAYDHWIAFAVLSILGGRMIFESLRDNSCTDRECSAEPCTDRSCPKRRQGSTEHSLRPSKMLPLALATSIYAMAVGVTFAFVQVEIIPAVSLIGVTTLIISMIGVKIGSMFGSKLRSKAQLAGGVILILIGLRMLFF